MCAEAKAARRQTSIQSGSERDTRPEARERSAIVAANLLSVEHFSRLVRELRGRKVTRWVEEEEERKSNGDGRLISPLASSAPGGRGWRQRRDEMMPAASVGRQGHLARVAAGAAQASRWYGRGGRGQARRVLEAVAQAVFQARRMVGRHGYCDKFTAPALVVRVVREVRMLLFPLVRRQARPGTVQVRCEVAASGALAG
jgi:hypothetical protein